MNVNIKGESKRGSRARELQVLTQKQRGLHSHSGGCKCQLTSVDVVVEGRERGVGRAPAGRLRVHHGRAATSSQHAARAAAPASARTLTPTSPPQALASHPHHTSDDEDARPLTSLSDTR